MSATADTGDTRLVTLLAVIAGMVDLTGFVTLGNVFTAHITGNLVLAAAVLVRSHQVNLAQVIAIPIFMLAVAGTWLVARKSGKSGVSLLRRLLALHFLLLVACFIFCVITHPSGDPHGLSAGIAVMIAVSAMASQFALLRLTLPRAPSTAVMTGNLTNAVLSLMRASFESGPPAEQATERLNRSLHLLIGFLVGCVVAGIAVRLWMDWAWLLPASLAAVALGLPQVEPIDVSIDAWSEH
jgi:uncharacterized membrane protein YoaK (UPF0700 family)